jgi:periplasmic protein TonB
MQVAPVASPPLPPPAVDLRAKRAKPDLRFECLVLSQPSGLARNRAATVGASVAIHAALVVAIVLIPLLTYNAIPEPGEALRAFFVAPTEVAPPPPPPPAPPAGARALAKAPAVSRPVDPSKFVAPIEVPDSVKPEESLDLSGMVGGVAGGVEGGVPGGVVGGIVGGLPTDVAPPPKPVVRIGGLIKQPRLIHQVQPVYPDLAAQARLTAIVIMEARVGTDGRVQTVSVLRGAPLFDQAALDAVKQWRYQPLLLNGVPTEFILTVTINFNLKATQD